MTLFLGNQAIHQKIRANNSQEEFNVNILTGFIIAGVALGLSLSSCKHRPDPTSDVKLRNVEDKVGYALATAWYLDETYRLTYLRQTAGDFRFCKPSINPDACSAMDPSHIFMRLATISSTQIADAAAGILSNGGNGLSNEVLMSNLQTMVDRTEEAKTFAGGEEAYWQSDVEKKNEDINDLIVKLLESDSKRKLSYREAMEIFYGDKEHFTGYVHTLYRSATISAVQLLLGVATGGISAFSVATNGAIIKFFGDVISKLLMDVPIQLYESCIDQGGTPKQCKSDIANRYQKALRDSTYAARKNIIAEVSAIVPKLFYAFGSIVAKGIEAVHPGNLARRIDRIFRDLFAGVSRKIDVPELYEMGPGKAGERLKETIIDSAELMSYVFPLGMTYLNKDIERDIVRFSLNNAGKAMLGDLIQKNEIDKNYVGKLKRAIRGGDLLTFSYNPGVPGNLPPGSIAVEFDDQVGVHPFVKYEIHEALFPLMDVIFKSNGLPTNPDELSYDDYRKQMESGWDKGVQSTIQARINKQLCAIPAIKTRIERQSIDVCDLLVRYE